MCDLNKKREQIARELKYIGYNFKYNGTQYLIDVILQLYLCHNEITYNLQGKVYPIVAEKYNRSIQNIKNNIANATEYMYRDCEVQKLKQYFYLYDDIKPTVKKVIITIINKIL